MNLMICEKKITSNVMIFCIFVHNLFQNSIHLVACQQVIFEGIPIFIFSSKYVISP